MGKGPKGTKGKNCLLNVHIIKVDKYNEEKKREERESRQFYRECNK